MQQLKISHALERELQMNGVDLLVEESVLIRRMLTATRRMCYETINKNEINFDDFDKMLTFVKRYADTLHFDKEKEILYPFMIERLGEEAETLINNEILPERDYARQLITELESSLQKAKEGDKLAIVDVIANAGTYVNVMIKHIKKMRTKVYPLAKKAITKYDIDEIDEKFNEYEKSREADAKYTYESQISTRERMRKVKQQFARPDARPTGQAVERTMDELTSFEKNIERHRIKMKYLDMVCELESTYLLNDSGVCM